MRKERVSAGIVVYRVRDPQLEVFLAHPGGPYYAHRDEGIWTIPKGEPEVGEELLAAAIREFEEEVGIALNPGDDYIPLGSIRQKGGKRVYAWGVAGDWDDSNGVRSNLFTCEWPPHSGVNREFPEVDRAQFLPLELARKKIKDTQIPLLDRLEAELGKS